MGTDQAGVPTGCHRRGTRNARTLLHILLELMVVQDHVQTRMVQEMGKVTIVGTQYILHFLHPILCDVEVSWRRSFIEFFVQSLYQLRLAA